MSINLVTYANQTVTPTNDAIIYERAIDQNGIFYGCNVTVTSNNVNITGGYGIVCGREFVINSESLTVTLAPSGTLEGRLYVRLDLADADAPIQLLTVTGNTLPSLVQDDDVNYTNGVWEMELATFTVGVSALSDVVETFETIVGSKPYTDYVVEEGTSGIWTYRKWNSGKCEAWRKTASLGTLTPTTWASPIRYADTTIALPGGLFNDEPIVFLTSTSNQWWVVRGDVQSTAIVVRLGTVASSAQAAYVHIYLLGTWK